MSKIEITYYLHGSRFTEQFTMEEIRRDLIEYGIPNAETPTDEQLVKQFKQLYYED